MLLANVSNCYSKRKTNSKNPTTWFVQSLLVNIDLVNTQEMTVKWWEHKQEHTQMSALFQLTASWTAASPKCPAAVPDLHARNSAPNWNNKQRINITPVSRLTTGNNSFILINHCGNCKDRQKKNTHVGFSTLWRRGSSSSKHSSTSQEKKTALNHQEKEENNQQTAYTDTFTHRSHAYIVYLYNTANSVQKINNSWYETCLLPIPI